MGGLTVEVFLVALISVNIPLLDPEILRVPWYKYCPIKKKNTTASVYSYLSVSLFLPIYLSLFIFYIYPFYLSVSLSLSPPFDLTIYIRLFITTLCVIVLLSMVI